MTTLLLRRFQSYYDAQPVLTTMATNSMLAGIADTVAQLVAATSSRLNRSRQDLPHNEFELRELESDVAMGEKPFITFDTYRLSRFMLFGFMMAPIQHRWFSLLGSVFPAKTQDAFSPVIKRVVADQILFAPVGLAAFYSFMTLADGKGTRALSAKFRDMYLPSLKANYILWPAAQIVNFRFVPLSLQLPFVSSVGIFWTAYLSLSNSSNDPLKEH